MNTQLINAIAIANKNHDMYAFLNQAKSLIIEDYIGQDMSGEAMCKMALLQTNQKIQDLHTPAAYQAMQIIGAFCSKLEDAIQELEEYDVADDYYAQIEEMAGRA